MGTDLALKVYMGYYFALACTYAFIPEKPLADSFPGLYGQDLYVTKLYHEVMGGLSFVLFLGCCPGTMGVLMGTMAWLCTMGKHKFVDNVEPPLAVQAMGVSCFLLALYGHFKQSNVGKWAFMAFNALNAFVFFSDAGGVVAESFPNLSTSSKGYFAASRCVEVMGTFCLAQVLTNCPGSLGRAMGMTAFLGLIYKHRTVDNIGPPPPVLGAIVVVTLLQYYSYLTKKTVTSSDNKKEK
jgi:hypothetical protein